MSLFAQVRRISENRLEVYIYGIELLDAVSIACCVFLPDETGVVSVKSEKDYVLCKPPRPALRRGNYVSERHYFNAIIDLNVEGQIEIYKNLPHDSKIFIKLTLFPDDVTKARTFVIESKYDRYREIYTSDEILITIAQNSSAGFEEGCFKTGEFKNEA